MGYSAHLLYGSGRCLSRENPHTYWPATIQCDTIGPILIGIRRKSDLAEPSQADPQKVSLKLDINYYNPDQLFLGKTKLSLECSSDGATISEGMNWQIYQAAGGFVTGRSNWVKVYINGDYKGIYTNIEQVDKVYLTDHGIDNDGWLFKIREQRTHEDPFVSNPFGFNWYPFDHPPEGEIPEVPAPADWLDQSLWRVNMPNLLALGAADSFIANTDGVVNKMNNFFWYDWSTDPAGTDPNYQQPRLYFPWDLDVGLKGGNLGQSILWGDGHLLQGLIKEEDETGTPFGYSTFQGDYLAIYREMIDGPLELSNLLAMVNSIEPVISTAMDTDPYQQTGSAAAEFQRIRDFLTARYAVVDSQLNALMFTLTATVTGSGSIVADPDRTQFADGETVELTAVASGTVFVRWEGDASGSDNPLVLTMDASKSVTAVFAAPGTDTTPPSPAPTFAVAPYATGSTSVAMASTIAVDPNGVEYYFECTAGGGHNSGWISDNSYEDTGLSASTLYSYRIKARDLSVNYNETAVSGSSSATTLAGVILPQDNYANADIAVDGTVSGTYTDTQASDNVYESILEEVESKFSFLEHKWAINVAGGDPVTFYVEAYGTDIESEGDTYTFAYSTTGADGTYTDMLTVIKTADDNVAQSSSLPEGLSGTVHIRVRDDDPATFKNEEPDTVYIDEMYIYSSGGGTLPGQDTDISPLHLATDVDLDADIIWTAGADSTGSHVYFGTDPTPDASEFKGTEAGTLFDPGTMAENTTYYFCLDAVNAAGVTTGDLTSFTTETLPVTVPDVTGLAQATAETNITTAGLTVGTVTTAYDDVVAAGNVISQDPIGGSSVPPETAVDIVVSLGLPSIPNVVGQDQTTAEGNITAVFVLGAVTTANSDTVAAGDVISQSLVGPATSGTAVDLVVSDGHAPRVISGHLLEPDDTTAIEGIRIEMSDSADSDITDPNGYYELTVDYGWSGIVEPNAVGYMFDPNEAGRTLTNVTSDTVLDLTGYLEAFIISGTILEDDAVTPIEGVTVTPQNGGGYYTAKYDGGGIGVTDPNGFYEVLVDHDWSGDVTPTHNAYVFDPNDLSYSNVMADIADQDYEGTMLIFSISGYVKNILDTPIDGVQVVANGGGTDTTDVTGYYEVWVSYGWSGTVTTAKEDYTFTPTDPAYSNVTADLTEDITAKLDADIDGDGDVDISDLMILCNNWLTAGDLNTGDLDGTDFVDMLDVGEMGEYWQE